MQGKTHIAFFLFRFGISTSLRIVVNVYVSMFCLKGIVTCLDGYLKFNGTQMHTGQIEIEAPRWMEIVQLSYDAWCQMDQRIFKAAWIACGYMRWEDMPSEAADVPLTLEDARQVLDVFGKLGGGSPQRCTCYEWQIQELKAGGVFMLVELCFGFL